MAKNSSPGKDEQIKKIIDKKILLLVKIKLLGVLLAKNVMENKRIVQEGFFSTNISGKDKILPHLIYTKILQKIFFEEKMMMGLFLSTKKKREKCFFQLYNCFFQFFSFSNLIIVQLSFPLLDVACALLESRRETSVIVFQC